MGIVDLRTNLKSLRYGKDTVGGGNSGQPFVTRAIPDDLSDVGRTGGPDFLLRGGTLLPRIVLNDATRISKLFYPGRGRKINTTNADDPLGIDASNNGRRPVNLIGTLFTAKQNILSLTNVNSSAGYEPFVQAERDKNGNFFQRAGSAINTFLQNSVALNQGIYTPLSTIGQTVGGALGVHLNKQGLNPLQKTSKGSIDGNTPLGLPTYLNSIAAAKTDEDVLGRKSRLYPLTISKIDTNTGADQNLYTYSGGPGATLGVGQTNIDMQSEYRTGENNINKNYFENKITPQFVLNGNIKLDNIFKTSIFNTYRSSIFGFETESGRLFDKVFGIRDDSVYQPGTYLKTDIGKLRSGTGGFVPQLQLSQEQIENKDPVSKGGKVENFSKPFEGTDYIPKSIDYTQAGRIEQRVKLGDPGKRANRSSYTIGRRDIGSSIDSVEGNSGYKKALDQINAFPIYQSGIVTDNKIKNDLVKFRIGVISNTDPSLKTYIHFRAFINSFEDNFTADWKGTNYMGRGEKFYKYGGFDRKISMGWTVAAQSKQELIPMWQKLNYLASVTAPDYSSTGYMSGNLITLTVGGYLYEQVGIMTGLNLSIPDESPWDIAISDTDTATRDASVKEMPMICNVSGFNFIPIHNFVPKVQSNDFAKGAKVGTNGGKFVGKYGQEQYIALSQTSTDGTSLVNNYGGDDKNINYIPK